MLKAFADEAPRLFLHLLGIGPLNAEAGITPLRTETAPPVVMPDYVAVLVVNADQPFTFHVEFHLDYYKEIPSEMARYGMSLAAQHRRPVVSLLVLLRPDRVPDAIPAIGEYAVGETRTTHPFRVVRLWEVAAGPVLSSKDPRLFPWALLMKSTGHEVRTLGAQVGRFGDEETIARFLTLGSLRYDRSALEEMLGGPKMGLVEAILEGSSLVKEAKEKAVAQGHAQGHAQGVAAGRADEARRLLRDSLKMKFPELGTMPEIDAITSVETLEFLLLNHVLVSTDSAQVARAIIAAHGK